jgi:hypothetical protein
VDFPHLARKRRIGNVGDSKSVFADLNGAAVAKSINTRRAKIALAAWRASLTPNNNGENSTRRPRRDDNAACDCTRMLDHGARWSRQDQRPRATHAESRWCLDMFLLPVTSL